MEDVVIKGILPHSLLTAVNVRRYGEDTLELTYKPLARKVVTKLLMRAEAEGHLEVVS